MMKIITEQDIIYPAIFDNFTFHFHQRNFVAFYIYLLKKWVTIRIMLSHVLQNNGFITSA